MQTEKHKFMQHTTLDNGVQVATRELPNAQSVAIGIFIDVGSRDELSSQAGIAHALEHMVFKGTDTLDVHQLAENLDNLGGHANAFTSRERTCFHTHVLHEDWQEAVSLLSDMLLRPALPEEEWQREREVIYAEMSMVDDNPDEWVYDQHISQLFSGHTMGKPVLGSKETLASFSAQDLRDYLNTHYRGKNVLIATAGRIQHEDVLSHIAQSEWGKSVAESGVERVQPKLHFGQQELQKQMEQAQVVASWPSVCITSPEKPVAWVANQLLGGSMSSILFREIREKRGLAYSVGSHLSAYTDTGLFSVSCSTMPDQLEPCLAVLNQTLDDVRQGVASDMIERAQRQLAVQFRMGMDSVEGSMMQLGALLDEKEVCSPLEWVNKVEAIQPKQVQDYLSKCLSENVLWTIARPEA